MPCRARRSGPAAAGLRRTTSHGPRGLAAPGPERRPRGAGSPILTLRAPVARPRGVLYVPGDTSAATLMALVAHPAGTRHRRHRQANGHDQRGGTAHGPAWRPRHRAGGGTRRQGRRRPAGGAGGGPRPGRRRPQRRARLTGPRVVGPVPARTRPGARSGGGHRAGLAAARYSRGVACGRRHLPDRVRLVRARRRGARTGRATRYPPCRRCRPCRSLRRDRGLVGGAPVITSAGGRRRMGVRRIRRCRPEDASGVCGIRRVVPRVGVRVHHAHDAPHGVGPPGHTALPAGRPVGRGVEPGRLAPPAQDRDACRTPRPAGATGTPCGCPGSCSV